MRECSLIDLLYYILHFLCREPILLLYISWVVRLFEVLFFNGVRYWNPVHCGRWWPWWRLCCIVSFNPFEYLLPVILTLSTKWLPLQSLTSCFASRWLHQHRRVSRPHLMILVILLIVLWLHEENIVMAVCTTTPCRLNLLQLLPESVSQHDYFQINSNYNYQHHSSL
jgi:hypothetical protein